MLEIAKERDNLQDGCVSGPAAAATRHYMLEIVGHPQDNSDFFLVVGGVGRARNGLVK